MRHLVNWSERTVTSASRFLDDDPVGLAQVFDATDQLSGEPRPAQSFPYGSDDLRRLRVGRYRVLFEINPTESTVTVLYVGRIAEPRSAR